MRDRDDGTLDTAQRHDLGVELHGQRIDDGGTQPGLRPSEEPVRFSNSATHGCNCAPFRIEHPCKRSSLQATTGCAGLLHPISFEAAHLLQRSEKFVDIIGFSENARDTLFAGDLPHQALLGN
jgi:hypothetical protein